MSDKEAFVRILVLLPFFVACYVRQLYLGDKGDSFTRMFSVFGAGLTIGSAFVAFYHI